MASRKSSHKMKSAITDERKKRLLRVHRRSIDQREMRQEGVNRRRQIDDMSPVVESQEASKNPSTTGTPVTQKAGHSRLEMLKKWKEERELKRKLEAMEKAKSKPGFKVKHIEYKDTDLYEKMKNAAVPTKQPVNIRQAPARAATSKTRAGTVGPPAANAAKTTTAKSNAKPTATKGVPATTMTKRTAVAAPEPSKKPVIPPVTRTTRNRGAASVKTALPVAPKKVKQSPPKRAGKPNFMAATTASQTRAAAKKEAAPPAAATSQKKRGRPAKASAVKDSGKVTARRGDTSPPAQPSFAPSDFVFEAPSSVASFVFKPLSPASSANFLFPQGSANSTTMHTFTERVGRTSTPMRDGKLPASTEDDISNKTSMEEQTEGHSARASRSKVRRSRTTHADGSPILENKLAASKTSSTLVADSGVEVNAAGMDTADVKTLSQESSADTTTSAEEGEACTDKQKSSPPVKSRKGRKSRQSVSRKQKAEDISDQENETEETEKPVVEENEDSSQTQPKKGKRRSKRVGIQADPEDSKEQASATKQRRKSRKSTTNSKLEAVSESENMQESIAEACVSAQPLLSEKMTEEQATPSKSNRSRRSTAAKSKEMVQETEAGERKEEPEQKLSTSRRSRRSNLPDAGDNKGSKRSDDDEAIEITVEENGEQGDVRTPKRARRSRRSVVAKQQEDSTENQDSVTLENKPATKSVTLVEPVEAENMVPEPTTPENQRRKLRDRHAKDDLFLTPGPPVSSQKRSTAKRRRTATMIALSSAKSPEEAIKIIATSPMIEMTRRTPKAKTSPELRNQSAALVFDENDFALVPMQLSSAFDTVSGDATTSDDNANSTEAETTHDTQPESAACSSKKQEITSGSSTDGETGERDVTTFRERLSSETEKLTQLSSHWTDIAETTKDLPEEAQGQIRTTVCQAQLLMDSHKKSKFNRFAGLVDRCEAGDPATTCQDLEGFWDLVYIEVKNIYNEFEKLEHLQQNNWQPDLPAIQASSQPAKKTKKSATGGSKKQKPAGKSKFAAFKAQLIKQRQEENASTGDAAEEKVFDAGFFKVNSPVRTPTYHCEAGTPSKSKGKNATPTTSKTSKEPSPATTTSTTPTDTPKKTDNKENVAHVLLRRSVGGTPGRRSYVPSVPSPLLKDGVSAVCSLPLSPSKAANSANRATEEGGTEVEEKPVVHTTPVRPRKSLTNRRSTRGRKSVSFLEKSLGDGEEEDDRVDLMAYLEPSNSQSNSPIQESVIEDSPFSVEDVLKHSQSDTPASDTPIVPQSSGRRQKNCLKSLPTSERRKSRRSVSFATSTNTSEGTFTLPSTPYNINSLVPGRRVTRRSMASPGQGEAYPLGELKELCATTPPLRRSARPSLLYTPPKVESNKPKTASKDVPVAKLISFSPSE